MIHIVISSPRPFMVEVVEAKQPGSPPCGRGESINEALGEWLILNQQKLGLVIEVDPSAQPYEDARRQAALLER